MYHYLLHIDYHNKKNIYIPTSIIHKILHKKVFWEITSIKKSLNIKGYAVSYKLNFLDCNPIRNIFLSLFEGFLWFENEKVIKLSWPAFEAAKLLNIALDFWGKHQTNIEQTP